MPACPFCYRTRLSAFYYALIVILTTLLYIITRHDKLWPTFATLATNGVADGPARSSLRVLFGRLISTGVWSTGKKSRAISTSGCKPLEWMSTF